MVVVRSIVRSFASLFLLSGLGVLGYQGYIRYDTGEWFGMDLLWLVRWLLSFHSANGVPSSLVGWLVAPQHWVVLHRVLWMVLDICPLSLTLIVVGSFLYTSVDREEKGRQQIIDEVEQEMRARREEQG